MPSAPLVFRASCGSFLPVYVNFMLKRATEKAAERVAMLTPRTRAAGVTLGLLLTLMFWGSLLLRCGDVERNPGPTGVRQSRTGSQSATTGRRTSMDRTGASLDAGQTTLFSTQSPTIADVMNKLDCKFAEMENSLKDLRDQFAAMHCGFDDLREEVGNLRKENLELAEKNSELLAKVEQLERKTDDLECRSKRNNLIFYGIPRHQTETNEQCEGKLLDLVTDKLDVKMESEFDRVHRLNAKDNSPVIACCSSYKDKLRILKAKAKLKGSNIFVGEDFSFRVREIRRGLSPYLKKARADGKRASMIFDHLIIDGKKYFLDSRGNLSESR